MSGFVLQGPDGSHRLRINIAHGFVILAFTALTFDPIIGSPSAAIFLLCGFALLVTDFGGSLHTLARWWPMLILPAYCLISTLWSQFPGNTLRYSIQLTITLALAVIIAQRVSPRSMLRIMFGIGALSMLASLVLSRGASGAAWQGFFGSKNAFSAAISVFALTSMGVLLDARSPRWLRGLGLIGVLGAGPLLVKAQSAGALITIGPCLTAMLAIKALRVLTAKQKLFLVLVGAFLAVAAAVVAISFGDQILAAVLETSGKDATLTGRTDLWAFGRSFIAEHPLWGVGYRAFWVPGYAPAEQLWAMFGEPSGAGFNFHDLYISNAVDLGLVGIGIEVAIIYVALALAGFLAIARPSGLTAFYFGLQLLLVLRSFVEVEVFFEFSVRSILVYCTLIYAVRAVSEWAAEARAKRAAAERRTLPTAGSLIGQPLSQRRYRHG